MQRDFISVDYLSLISLPENCLKSVVNVLIPCSVMACERLTDLTELGERFLGAEMSVK